MVQVNLSKKVVNCKVVYCGPAGSGKTSNLACIQERIAGGGELTSINSELDRTLFFEYLQLELGRVESMRTRLHLYSIPNRTNAQQTRRGILDGVDGVVFVADSRAEAMEANIKALAQLEEDLAHVDRSLDDLPIVFQYNHRGAPTALPVGDLNAVLNPKNHPMFRARADTGDGVLPTIKHVATLAMEKIGHFGRRAETRKIRRPTRRLHRPAHPQSNRLKKLANEPEEAPETKRHEVVGIHPRPTRRWRKLTGFFTALLGVALLP